MEESALVLSRALPGVQDNVSGMAGGYSGLEEGSPGVEKGVHVVWMRMAGCHC